MKKLALVLVASLLALGISGSAYAYSVILEDFEDGSEQVELIIENDGTTEIKITASVVEPTIGDIRGIFFDLNNSPLPEDLLVDGIQVTAVLVDENNVQKVAKDVNMTPNGPFDVGVEIGTEGMGSDFIAKTIFTISSDEVLWLGDSFGARLTSVGVDNQDSSKLVGNYAPVPEPSTVFLLGAGLLGILGLGRKFKK